MNALVESKSPALVHWELTGPAAGADTELQRENITYLCTSMLWLRSWWDSHQDAVRAIDSKAAAEVHDHFIDGAIFARGTARGMKLELDEPRIRNYRWGNSAQTLRLVVAMPMPAAAEGRTA
jgi:hypothetical protein